MSFLSIEIHFYSICLQPVWVICIGASLDCWKLLITQTFLECEYNFSKNLMFGTPKVVCELLWKQLANY